MSTDDARITPSSVRQHHQSRGDVDRGGRVLLQKRLEEERQLRSDVRDAVTTDATRGRLRAHPRMDLGGVVNRDLDPGRHAYPGCRPLEVPGTRVTETDPTRVPVGHDDAGHRRVIHQLDLIRRSDQVTDRIIDALHLDLLEVDRRRACTGGVRQVRVADQTPTRGETFLALTTGGDADGVDRRTGRRFGQMDQGRVVPEVAGGGVPLRVLDHIGDLDDLAAVVPFERADSRLLVEQIPRTVRGSHHPRGVDECSATFVQHRATGRAVRKSALILGFRHTLQGDGEQLGGVRASDDVGLDIRR